MPATIRLTRMGRKKHPFYRLVVLDSRARRDGAYIDKLGYYNPFVTPYEVQLDHDKAIEWLSKGAGMSDTARSLLRNEGVLYRWHLMKSGLALEEIEAKVEEYRARHGARLEGRRKNLSEKEAAARQKQLEAEKAQLKAKQAASEGKEGGGETEEASPESASEEAAASDAPTEEKAEESKGGEAEAAPEEKAEEKKPEASEDKSEGGDPS